MIRYLLNIFWVVTGRPNRVSEPYRPTLMIECNEWREERLVKRLRDERIMRDFNEKCKAEYLAGRRQSAMLKSMGYMTEEGVFVWPSKQKGHGKYGLNY